MSMQSYPIITPAAFLVDHEVTAYAILSVDRKNDEVPDEIKTVLADGSFAAKARAGTLPCDYSDVIMGHEVLEDGTVYCSQFAGEILSLFPDKSRKPFECSYDDDFIVYIPCANAPDLFRAVYGSPDELLIEFIATVKGLDVELPPDFDWWAHIVSIEGTTFA